MLVVVRRILSNAQGCNCKSYLVLLEPSCRQQHRASESCLKPTQSHRPRGGLAGLPRQSLRVAQSIFKQTGQSLSLVGMMDTDSQCGNINPNWMPADQLTTMLSRLKEIDTPSSVLSRNNRRFLVYHASVLEHVGPLATGTSVAVLQVLPEMIGPVEFLACVALPELVHILQVVDAQFPVRVGNESSRGRCRVPRASELLATIPANVCVAGAGGAIVECPLVARQCRARPAMATDMQRVLVSFGLVLVLETVAAKRALVLFLRFMCTVEIVSLARATVFINSSLVVRPQSLLQ